MRFGGRIGAMVAATLCAVTAAGCFYFKALPGRSFDETKVAQIQAGVTTLDEVFTWFGPPDFIIDGTQRMLDFKAVAPGQSDKIPTRVLTAPEGTVLLMYAKGGGEGVTVVGLLPRESGDGMAVQRTHVGVRDNELFIFVSKKERRVVSVVGSPDGK